MRDLICALLLLGVLVWAFSSTPREEPQEKKTAGMYLPAMAGESPTEGKPKPTDGETPTMPAPTIVPTTPTEPTVPTADNLPAVPTKTIDEMAWEVIIGYWGYMEDRWQRLTDAGYDAMAVQQRVNEILEQERRNQYGD